MQKLEIKQKLLVEKQTSTCSSVQMFVPSNYGLDHTDLDELCGFDGKSELALGLYTTSVIISINL